MDFINGGNYFYYYIGELFFHLRNAQRFDEEKTRFYACELIVVLKFLHENGIIYRFPT